MFLSRLCLACISYNYNFTYPAEVKVDNVAFQKMVNDNNSFLWFIFPQVLSAKTPSRYAK